MPLTSYCYSYVITEIGYLVVGFFMTWCNFPRNNIRDTKFLAAPTYFGVRIKKRVTFLLKHVATDHQIGLIIPFKEKHSLRRYNCIFNDYDSK